MSHVLAFGICSWFSPYAKVAGTTYSIKNAVSTALWQSLQALTMRKARVFFTFD